MRSLTVTFTIVLLGIILMGCVGADQGTGEAHDTPAHPQAEPHDEAELDPLPLPHLEAAPASSLPLRVVATTSIVGDVVGQVGGQAIELTTFAKNIGADATLQVGPYYNKPTQQGFYEHFKAIAEEVDLPVVLYNIPGRC